jgi:N-acylneuraminate cytidylyltransferase/CMP-N,N'-diacetyllegionaminic acid synthase
MDTPTPGLLILVPARGGSKGLPGKNLLRLGGIPLLTWTARTIEAAGLSARAVLSTEDPEIAAVGRAAGLETPFVRPSSLAQDDSSMIDVVEHAVSWMEREGGYPISAIMLLQPTSPFRRTCRLRQALDLLAQPDTDAVIGVDTLLRTPSLLFRESAGGLLQALAPWKGPLLRQDIPPMFSPNGTMYLITRESLRRQRRLFPERLRGLPTGRVESIDIDTPEDWELATAAVAAGLVKP